MNTILSAKQQKEFLATNWQLEHINHKWSTRGYGNSKILDHRDNELGRAGGCGYDRFGAAMGDAFNNLFESELLKLANKARDKQIKNNYSSVKGFYGLNYNRKNKTATIDGGCGSNCVYRILNAIGFSIESVGSTNREANNGQEFFKLAPITKHDKQFLNR